VEVIEVKPMKAKKDRVFLLEGTLAVMHAANVNLAGEGVIATTSTFL
jgi:hypothetical protein